jgi:hypothetical protein
MAGAGAEPVFSASDLEQLCFRRYNPFSQLTAANLSLALDQFDSGVLMSAALFWQQIATRDATTITVKSKREDAVALRDVTHTPMEDSPEAKDQAAALELFYRGIKAGHALNRHTTGGKPLLLQQMMESVAFLYAVHHIVWKPDAATLWKLPSGRTVPALTALFEQVPVQFFEARTGELRFLGLSLGYTGEPLAPDNWLVTTGPGLMRAASSLFYFKRLAQHDMVNFSEKFGTPGIEVETTGAKDSAEGKAARDLASQLAANWRGVRYGSDKNGVNFLWPQGGVSGTSLPMHTITDDAKRDMAILWLGADLSTMSRGGSEKAVGSNAQEDEREKRERADCARISETLQATIDPIVIRWFFGEDAPILAKTVIEMPINEDRALLSKLVGDTVALGAEVPMEPVMKRLGVPQAKKGEDLFTKPAQPLDLNPQEPEKAINAFLTPEKLQELLRMPEEQFEIAINSLAVNGDPNHDEKGRFAATQQARGEKAMQLSLKEKTDVPSAMEHPTLGEIDFRHGLGGDSSTGFKGGYGVAHIAAKHGEATAMKLPEIIAKGVVTHGSSRTFIDHEDHHVVLSKDFNGTPANHWLVTGYDKKRATDEPDEVNDSTDSLHPKPTRFRLRSGSGCLEPT